MKTPGMIENIVDVFDSWLSSRLENVHTIIPGKIDKYEGHGSRKARVKPLVKMMTIKGEMVSIPVIDNVPVIFPSSGAFSLLFPVKPGDGCLILFSECSIGNFLNSTIEVDPEDRSRFSFTDAVCIPGLWSFKSVSDSTNVIEITDAGAVEVTAKTVKLLSGSEAFVKGNSQASLLHTFFGVLKVLVGGSSGTNAAAINAIAAAAGVADGNVDGTLSAKIKGE